MRLTLIYGTIAGAVAIAIMSATIALDLTGHGSGAMLVGYLIMLAALSLIFIGVKRYRDVECGGVIRFGRAFLLGLGIAAVASIIYAIGWEIYLAASGREFMAEYSATVLSDMRAEGAGAAALEAASRDMAELTEKYHDPLFRFPLTFVEIFPVGLLVALVSAALLRNPKLLPSRG